MKKISSVILSVILVLSLLTGCSSTSSSTPAQTKPAEKKLLSLATCPVGGAWNVIGAGMADIVNKANPDTMKITAEITGGGVENIRMLQNGQADFIFTNGNLVYDAYKGLGEYVAKPVTNMRGVMGGEMLVFQLYTLKGNGINSYADLKGKKVACSSLGSVKSVYLTAALKAIGLEINKDWTPEYISDADGADALADGLVDAVFYSGALKAAAPLGISETHDVKFIPVDKEQAKKIIASNPAYTEGVIPGGTYKGNDQDLYTIACPTIIAAPESLDEQIVYNFLKTLLENPDQVAATHSSAKTWNKQNVKQGIEGVLPFHPGAEKYLKEIGILP